VKPDVVEELDTTEDQLIVVVGAKVGSGVGLPGKYVGEDVGYVALEYTELVENDTAIAYIILSVLVT